MTPGSANFAGMTEAQRNAIVEALLAQAQQGEPAPDTSFLNPYQDIVDPSDPASYDSTLGEVVAGFPSPSIHNPDNVIDPSPPPSILEAPSPEQQEADVFDTPDPSPSRSTLEAPTKSEQEVDAAFQSLSQQAANEAAGMAIAADIAGPLSDMNAAVNDAVAGYAIDQGFGGFGAPASGNPGDPGSSFGGFTSDPGGFSAPGGFGDGVSAGIGIGAGLGAGLGEGAGLGSEAGGGPTGVSSGPGGTGEGGAGGGGGGGAGK